MSAKPLKDVAHAQVNALFDIQALLEAAHDVFDIGDQPHDKSNRVRRLIAVTEDRVLKVIKALTPYV